MGAGGPAHLGRLPEEVMLQQVKRGMSHEKVQIAGRLRPGGEAHLWNRRVADGWSGERCVKRRDRRFGC